MEKAKELIGKYKKISPKINTGTQHNTRRISEPKILYKWM